MCRLHRFQFFWFNPPSIDGSYLTQMQKNSVYVSPSSDGSYLDMPHFKCVRATLHPLMVHISTCLTSNRCGQPSINRWVISQTNTQKLSLCISTCLASNKCGQPSINRWVISQTNTHNLICLSPSSDGSYLDMPHFKYVRATLHPLMRRITTCTNC